MKILYLDTTMGAAGDMISGALFSLFSENDQNKILDQLNRMGLDGVCLRAEKGSSCGIGGIHMHVLVHGQEEGHVHAENGHMDHQDSHHVHTSLEQIFSVVDGLSVPSKVKEGVREVYMKLADAESRAHGVPVTEIHFHEVGMMDAVMDITSALYMLNLLAVDKVVVSPVRTGYGTVRCAHGILPVPAPATAFLLEGVPSFSGDIEGEMCTPTGAALISHIADIFSHMPVMKMENVGYGLGAKETGALNAVRAILGSDKAEDTDTRIELNANIDDMTGEEMGYALEKIRRAGALEAFTTPVMMKKDRPGMLLTVICREESESEVVKSIFRYTQTIGIRRKAVSRYVLNRKTEEVSSGLGTVRIKTSYGYGVHREKYEYDDLKRIADEKQLPIREIRERLDAERRS